MRQAEQSEDKSCVRMNERNNYNVCHVRTYIVEVAGGTIWKSCERRQHWKFILSGKTWQIIRLSNKENIARTTERRRENKFGGIY